jgi:Uma2 family endonuclease
MVAVRKRAPTRMTLDEFLGWDPGEASGHRWQLLDGEPVAMAPASELHGAVQGEIIRLLGNHLIARHSQSRVIAKPGIVPRVWANRNYRIPDVCVTCAAPALGLMVSEPVLLVEILTPSNAMATRANIWADTTIPSVRDLLVVDSTRIEVELLRRRPDSMWSEQPDMLEANAILTLRCIEFSVVLTALHRTSALAVG